MRNTLAPPFAEIQEKRNQYNPDMQSGRWKQICIYRLPGIFKGDRAKCYTPLWVSFGPYHHGQGHLHQAEGHKERALFHMCNSADCPVKDLWQSLQSVEGELRDYYDNLTTDLPSATFLQMMLLDGCFMLEIMRAYHRMMNTTTTLAAAGSSTYAETDPIFGSNGMFYVIPMIKNDMLMLENQIPLRVLKKLVEAERRYRDYESYVVELVVNFLSEDVGQNGADRTSLIGSCKDARHVLDVFRKMQLFDNGSGCQENNSGVSVETRTERSNRSRSMLNQNINDNSRQNDPPRHNNYKNSTRSHRPATRLREAGVEFRQSGSSFLPSLSFEEGVLSLPRMVVDDFTEARILNLMAFERMQVKVPNQVSSYMAFMDRLIDTAKDVELLQEEGILQNMLGSDEEVANLFNRLCRGVAVDREGFTADVEQKLVQYSSQTLNKWLASLRHNYLDSPWTIVSIVAAFVLLVLTLIQTICSVKATFYAKPNDTKFN